MACVPESWCDCRCGPASARFAQKEFEFAQLHWNDAGERTQSGLDEGTPPVDLYKAGSSRCVGSSLVRWSVARLPAEVSFWPIHFVGGSTFIAGATLRSHPPHAARTLPLYLAEYPPALHSTLPGRPLVLLSTLLGRYVRHQVAPPGCAGGSNGANHRQGGHGNVRLAYGMLAREAHPLSLAILQVLGSRSSS